MKKLLITPVLLLALLISGCATMQPQTEYPWLEAGIDLTQMQIMLQKEFDELKMFVDDETRATLDREIRPLLLESQGIIYRYNQAVLMDLPTAFTEQEIKLMLRRIGQKMMEVLNGN